MDTEKKLKTWKVGDKVKSDFWDVSMPGYDGFDLNGKDLTVTDIFTMKKPSDSGNYQMFKLWMKPEESIASSRQISLNLDKTLVY